MNWFGQAFSCKITSATTKLEQVSRVVVGERSYIPPPPCSPIPLSYSVLIQVQFVFLRPLFVRLRFIIS